MRKVFVGTVIATLFFFVGRNQPPIAETVSHGKNESSKNAQDSDQSPQPSLSQQTKIIDSALSQPEPALALADRLLQHVDSELFETLYSSEFKAQWSKQLPTLKQRLFSNLPSNDQVSYEKEITARLGILKALSSPPDSENNDQLKELLVSYIAHEAKKPNTQWLLQREAMHTLSETTDLTEEELRSVTGHLDLRARNTASLPDREIIDRTIEGEQ